MLKLLGLLSLRCSAANPGMSRRNKDSPVANHSQQSWEGPLWKNVASSLDGAWKSRKFANRSFALIEALMDPKHVGTFIHYFLRFTGDISPFCSVSGKSGASLFLACSHRNAVAHITINLLLKCRRVRLTSGRYHGTKIYFLDCQIHDKNNCNLGYGKSAQSFFCIKFFQIRDVPTQIPGHPGHSLSKTTEKGHLHKVFVRDIPTSGSRMSQEYPAQKLYV